MRFPMPFDNPRTYPGHSGVDFPQNRGTPIRASGPGRVLRLPKTDAGGHWTTILYDNGVTVGYAHQDNPVTVVKVGERVREGTVIGYVGSLGRRSTGPHLHMERIGHGTYAAMMAILDTSRVVGTPAPASTPKTVPASPEEDEEDMYIANVKNGNFYMVIGKQAHALGAASGARESGIPIINYVDDWAVKQLKAGGVTGIGNH